MMEHGAHHSGHPAAPVSTDPKATLAIHGHLVFGEETIYLSHLPMFMFDPFRHPHNFQVLLEVTFPEEAGDPQGTYVADRRRTGTRVYTFEPERFSLTDLAPTDPQRPPLRSFRGTLFRGHFERGGTPILEDVLVHVERVLYFQRLDPEAEPLSALEYLVFGKGQERFAAHVITRPPDFDQILAVDLDGQEVDALALQDGLRVTFPDCQNSMPPCLQEGEQLTGCAQNLDGDGAEARELSIVAGTEFYFEANELSEPMN